MGEQIAPELVERMVANLREFAGSSVPDDKDNKWSRCRDILADLPKPVDPDLIEARNLLADHYAGDAGYYHSSIRPVLTGEADDQPRVRAVLAAIKRGRELALAQGHAA